VPVQLWVGVPLADSPMLKVSSVEEVAVTVKPAPLSRIVTLPLEVM
jgi:hypothetical protein